jgi:prepilin-type processing-associated H-X9-DG protein
MNGTWAVNRGGQWINGHFGNTLYNHYYPPNPVGKWDCGNKSHNKALSTARSYHTGGVNLALADGSIRFVYDSVSLTTWRALATRASGDIPGDF